MKERRFRRDLVWSSSRGSANGGRRSVCAQRLCSERKSENRFQTVHCSSPTATLTSYATTPPSRRHLPTVTRSGAEELEGPRGGSGVGLLGRQAGREPSELAIR